MIKFILMDIEGTTSSIDFVHQELFPYSYSKIDSYLNQNLNSESVQKIIQDFKAYIQNKNDDLSNKTFNSSLETVIQVAKKMIHDDIKFGPLKELQGLIWREGYLKNEIKGHVYEDVPLQFEAWSKNKFELGLYSSGSVLAQKLLFSHTAYGDLTAYLSFFFDTAIGGKLEVTSYTQIARALNKNENEILFLSDRLEELNAADKAGLRVALVNRDRPSLSNVPYKQVTQLTEVII